MAKQLVLTDRIYNILKENNRTQVILKYEKYLKKVLEGFPKTRVEIKKLRKFDSRFEVIITGPEEVFASNILKKKVGIINDFNAIEVGKIYNGNMVNVGKVGFGIFVDCGIFNPPADVLLSLNTLRTQLCKDAKISLKKIIDAYEFVDHFPVSIKIIEKDEEKQQFSGELADQTLSLFERIKNESIEGIFISGTTKNQFKKSIEKKGHFRDVISVKRFGYLEHIALLKEGTEAPGIIANIGKDLTGCKMSAIRPKRIKELEI
ncbi:MAG: DUF2110 family protein [Promethearchaeota archaeon]|nr:MAG: DUF2110 family protein [Candidatus Lokiarchaeota archaeon]